MHKCQLCPELWYTHVTSFISATRSSRAFIRLSCALTTTLPAKWFIGRNRQVTPKPQKQDTPWSHAIRIKILHMWEVVTYRASDTRKPFLSRVRPVNRPRQTYGMQTQKLDRHLSSLRKRHYSLSGSYHRLPRLPFYLEHLLLREHRSPVTFCRNLLVLQTRLDLCEPEFSRKE